MLAFVLLASGCSRYYDALIRNPCPHEVRVETYDDPPETFNRYWPNRAVTLPAGSTTNVEDAYAGVGGRGRSMRIVDYGVIPVDGGHDVEIELPLEAC